MSDKIPEYERVKKPQQNSSSKPKPYTTTRDELRKRLKMDEAKPSGLGMASNMTSFSAQKKREPEEKVYDKPQNVIKSGEAQEAPRKAWDLKKPKIDEKKKSKGQIPEFQNPKKRDVFLNEALVNKSVISDTKKVKITPIDIKSILNIKNLAALAVGMIFGTGVLFGAYAPFAMVACAVGLVMYDRPLGISLILGAIVGSTLSLGVIQGGELLLAASVMNLIGRNFINKIKTDPQDQQTVWALAAGIFVCLFVSKVAIRSIWGNGSDFLLSGAIEGGMAACVSAMIIPSILLATKRKKLALDMIDLGSLLIVGCIVCTGLQFFKFYDVSLGRIFALVATASLGYAAGAGTGSICGASMSLMLAMGGSVTQPVVIACICLLGLFTGLMKKHPKIYAAIIMMCVSLLSVTGVVQDVNYAALILEVALAVAVFLLMPMQIFKRMDIAGVKEKLKISELKPIKAKDNIFIQRIERLKSLFEDLAKGMNGSDLSKYDGVFDEWLEKDLEEACEINSTMTSTDDQDNHGGIERLKVSYEENPVVTNRRSSLMRMASVMSNVCEGSCAYCKKYVSCWQGNFFRTYKDVSSALTLCEINGEIKVEDLPKDFKSRCIRQDKIIEAISTVCRLKAKGTVRDFEAQRNKNWDKNYQNNSGMFSLDTLREVFSMELNGLIRAMDELTKGLRADGCFEEETRQALYKRLSRLGLNISEILVKKHKAGIEIEVRKAPCSGDHECSNAVIPLIANYTNQQFMLWRSDCCNGYNSVNSGVRNNSCEQCKECKLVLMPAVKYQLEVDVVQLSRNGGDVNGDSTIVKMLGDGRMIIAISDGMGVGMSASRESRVAVKMLAKLLETGLDSEFAVQTVNLMMLMRSRDDSFTTIDLIVADLFTGEAEIVKAGAPQSVIRRGREVTSVGAASLPAGVFIPLKVEGIKVQLEEDDVVVMMSDGVTDAAGFGQDWSEKLNKVIRYAGDSTPEEISQAILQLGCGMTSKTILPKDDMTVITVKMKSVKSKGAITPVIMKDKSNELEASEKPDDSPQVAG